MFIARHDNVVVVVIIAWHRTDAIQASDSLRRASRIGATEMAQRLQANAVLVDRDASRFIEEIVEPKNQKRFRYVVECLLLYCEVFSIGVSGSNAGALSVHFACVRYRVLM